MRRREGLVTDSEFARIMERRRELRGVEFKGPGLLSEGRLAAQVVKAAIGMANRRSGGSVIIGVQEDAGFTPVGLSETEAATWKYDAVADRIASYADPGVEFELEIKEFGGQRFAVIEVAEFADIPVLCKRSYGNVLHDGACYVRTRRKPETADLPTYADMRDLLDLAIEKGVRRSLEWAQRVGLYQPTETPAAATDERQFGEQQGDLQ